MYTRRIAAFGRLGSLVAGASIVAVLAIAAPAQAALINVTGVNSVLTPNFTTINHLATDNIYNRPLAPAELTSIYTIRFPITGGTVDTDSMNGVVNHAGGLLLTKYNQDGTIAMEQETLNPRIVNGNTLTFDVMGLIPSPTADLVNPQYTVDDDLTIHYEADVNLTAGTAVVLNVLFSTNVFSPGLNLGHIRSTITGTPVIPTPPMAHPRPGGGTPLRVALVPSFEACESPDATHAAPLSFGSCSSSNLESSLLATSTVGRGEGTVRFDAMPGDPSTDPSTGGDEADIGIGVLVKDVLTASDDDYTGQLLIETPLRLTDRANDIQANTSGTVQDGTFSVPVSCSANPGPAGGSCNLNTTFDTLMPGLAREGARSVISAFNVRLKDAGPDGEFAPGFGGCVPSCGSGDEEIFLTQGVMTP